MTLFLAHPLRDYDSARMITALIFAAAAIHPQVWPKLTPPAKNAQVEKQIDALISKMSLEDKVAQTIQPSVAFIKPDDVRKYHFGSVLNGGGGFPGDIRKVTARDWLALA